MDRLLWVMYDDEIKGPGREMWGCSSAAAVQGASRGNDTYSSRNKCSATTLNAVRMQTGCKKG
jgi:hypothetical protein